MLQVVEEPIISCLTQFSSPERVAKSRLKSWQRSVRWSNKHLLYSPQQVQSTTNMRKRSHQSQVPAIQCASLPFVAANFFMPALNASGVIAFLYTSSVVFMDL